MYSTRALKQGLQFLLQSRREATKIYPQTVGLLVASLDLEAKLSLPLSKPVAVAVCYRPEHCIWVDAKLLQDHCGSHHNALFLVNVGQSKHGGWLNQFNCK